MLFWYVIYAYLILAVTNYFFFQTLRLLQKDDLFLKLINHIFSMLLVLTNHLNIFLCIYDSGVIVFISLTEN